MNDNATNLGEGLIQTDKNRVDHWLSVIRLSDVLRLLKVPPGKIETHLDYLQPATVVGNHYHQHKDELVGCAYGHILVSCFDTATRERYERELRAEPGSRDHQLVFIKRGVAHVMRNLSADVSVLLVFSSGAPRSDDMTYEVGTAG